MTATILDFRPRPKATPLDRVVTWGAPVACCSTCQAVAWSRRAIDQPCKELGCRGTMTATEE